MFIQTEATPNPATIKFIPGRPVLESGTLNVTTPEEAARAPLAKRLFDINGVCGVYFGSDFITVTKTEDQDWLTLKTLVLDCLVHYFATHSNVEVFADAQSASSENDDDEITREIKELLDSRIRPAVAMDGGDIVFDRFDDGIVYLHMQGSCSGCPSSSVTLKSGIENMLRYYIPEVREVREALPR